jgi:hypothetical protein
MALGLLVAVTLPTLSVAGAPMQAPADVKSQLQPINDCVRNNRRLAVSFLIDESGSLRDTDPSAARVTGVKAALAALNEITEGEGRSEVHVKLWGFSVRGDVRQDWARLENGSLRALQDAAEQFRTRDGGFDTDYVNAVRAARGDLAEQVAAMDPAGDRPVCKLLLWFTDGKLDIDDRSSASTREMHGDRKEWAPEIDLSQPGSGDRAAEKGRELMCAPQGEMQQLRDDGVFTAVVALETQIAPQDRDFLMANARGAAGPRSCGVPGESTGRMGAYVSSANVDELVFGIYGVANPNEVPPGQVDKGTCPNDQPCPQGSHTFVLDEGLSRFNLLAISREPSIRVLVTAPNGQSADLGRGGAGQADLAAVRLRWSWLSESVVLLNGDLPGGDRRWAGTWRMTFVDPTGQHPEAVNRLAVYVFGNLEARLVPGTRLRKGEAGRIQIRIQNAKGEPQTSRAFVQGSTLVASVAAAGGDPVRLELTPSGDGVFEASYTPPEDLDGVTLNLHTDLTIQTSTGVTLPTVGTDDTIPLDPPTGFAPVDLGNLDALVLAPVKSADGTTSGPLRFTGAPNNDVCVWLTSGRAVRRPGGVDAVRFRAERGTSQASCVTVPRGEGGSLDVTAAVAGAGRGRVSGDLVVGMRNEGNGKVVEQRVPVRFEVAVPPGHDAGRALLLVLAGIGLPLLGLYLLNWRSARFETFDTLRTTNVHIKVTPTGVERVDGKDRLVDPLDVKPFATPPSLREFTVGSLAFRARMPRLPFGAVTGRVSSAPRKTVSNRGLHGAGDEAIVALGLGLVWVCAVDAASVGAAGRAPDGPVGQEVRGELLVLFGSNDSFEAQVAHVEADLRRKLPNLLGALAAKVGPPPTDLPSPTSGPGHGGAKRTIDIPVGSSTPTSGITVSLPPAGGSGGARPVVAETLNGAKGRRARSGRKERKERAAPPQTPPARPAPGATPPTTAATQRPTTPTVKLPKLPGSDS